MLLQGIRDNEATLPDSQRLYYNNYEYYNDYEDLYNDYRNDLSKLRFNLTRKSKALIVLYDALSSDYSEMPHERLLKSFTPKYCHHANFINEDFKTLDDLLYRFVLTFHENNYSDIKADREENKDQFEIIILKFLDKALHRDFQITEEEDYAVMSGILQDLKQKGDEVGTKLLLLFEREGKIQTTQFLERWFAFEHYWKFLIQKKLQAQSKNQKIQNYYLFQFCLYFRNFFRDISSGNNRNILLLAQPFTPLLSSIIHPLIIPLNFTLKNNPTPPRILFVNLDGRQTYYNLRAVSTLPSTVRYISIFRQANGHELNDFKLQKSCDQFQVDAEYVNVNCVHSELLFRQIRPSDDDGTALPFNENIILYPLNSQHLRKSYSQFKLSEGKNKIQDRRLPLLSTSEDIRWLWKEVIVSQAEEWAPELVIVSYNGSLDLKEDDFKQIIKDLTILADHRVILYTNMSGLFKSVQEDGGMEQQMDDEWSVSKIQLIQQYIEKHVPYNYEQVDEERYFTNLSTFIKMSSGGLSLKQKIKNNPISRYYLGERLQYIERLAELPEFQGMLTRGNCGSSIQKLFKQFASRESRQNRKQNQLWQKRIQQIQKQLIQLKFQSILQQHLDKKQYKRDVEIAYRIQMIKQELEVEELLIHGDGLDVQTQFREYLRRGKERLLLQNLENYRYRKAYMGEEEERGGRIRCLRFCLEDGEEILLQKYTQVILDEKKTRVFVVNFRTSEDGHIILQGETQDKGGNFLKLRRVDTRLEQTLGDLNLQNKNQILRLNYSHCFIKQKLYLYWPQQWDIRQEIRCRLLGLQYSPPHINYMIRLHFNPQERNYLINHLRCTQTGGVPSVPRRGCVGLEAADNRFYIFGGIYDSRLDFYTNGSAVSVANIQDDTFYINSVPKRKQRYVQKLNCLKPKMNYRVERSARASQDGGSVLLSGGYGRSFTNFHSLFSYQCYSAAVQLEGLKVTKLDIKNYRLTKLQKPLSVGAIGRFLVGGQGQVQERFSEGVKDWVLAQGKDDKGGERQLLSVLQEQLRTQQFKSDHKRNYLFGWDRTIRERIYIPHCWSPQLQIVAGGRLYLVYTALKTQKSSNYNIGNFLIPKEEDVVSLCLQEDRLLLLSNSPILHSLDNRHNNYVLYEGSLANMSDLLNRRQLPMHERYQFKNISHQQALFFKTIFALDDRIYLLGGLSKGPSSMQIYSRQDFLLERAKDKLKLRVRKLQSAEDTLELTSPVVVRHQDGFLLYSVVSEQRYIPKGNDSQTVEQFWRLKIQTFSANDNVQEETLLSGPLLLYHPDFQTATIQRRKPNFQEPKLVKIISYSRFSSSLLRQFLEKVYMKINRFEQEKYQLSLQVMRQLLRERDETRINQLLQEHHHKGNTFKQLLGHFDFLLDQEKKERENLQNQELVKDLRSLYSLLNKHLFECLMEPEGGDIPLYRFILEGKASRKVKYIAIGPLLSTRLRFLRIRYKNQLAICLNETCEEELFFNTNVLGCEQIMWQKIRGNSIEWQQEPVIKKIQVSYRA